MFGLIGGGQLIQVPLKKVPRSLGNITYESCDSQFIPSFPKELFKTHTWSCHSLAYDLANSSPAWPGQPPPASPQIFSLPSHNNLRLCQNTLPQPPDLPALLLAHIILSLLGLLPPLTPEKKKKGLL